MSESLVDVSGCWENIQKREKIERFYNNFV